jgi:hypothetical protein
MKSEFGIRMSLYISISFKKWKSLYSAVVVALKSSMCSCIMTKKKSMILGNRISFGGCVCGCVCVYDLYNCIIWNNHFSPVGAGCVVCMVDLYIFLYSCLY